MSDLIVAVIRIAFLALMWLFIVLVAGVVRRDMFGRKVEASSLQPAAGPVPLVPTRLAVTQGAQQGLSVPVESTINLGRAADSTFYLEDDYASSRHAQLTQTGPETWLVTDLGSTNGTYLNGIRVTSPVPMMVGDVLRIGKTMMRLEV